MGILKNQKKEGIQKKFLYTYMNKTLYLIVSNIKIKNLFVTEKIFASINNF